MSRSPAQCRTRSVPQGTPTTLCLRMTLIVSEQAVYSSSQTQARFKGYPVSLISVQKTITPSKELLEPSSDHHLKARRHVSVYSISLLLHLNQNGRPSSHIALQWSFGISINFSRRNERTLRHIFMLEVGLTSMSRLYGRRIKAFSWVYIYIDRTRVNRSRLRACRGMCIGRKGWKGR